MMITFAEVKQSPRDMEEVPVKDFELSVSELISLYRHRYDQTQVVKALREQADLVEADEGWVAQGGKKGDDEQSEQEQEDDQEPAEEEETEEETGAEENDTPEPGAGEPPAEPEGERPGAA